MKVKTFINQNATSVETYVILWIEVNRCKNIVTERQK